MKSDLEALYKHAKANLWVEDPETKVWLDAVWSGGLPTIQVLVARGREGVDAVCREAYVSGHKHVFGLVDKDFGSSNHARWSSMQDQERVYRLHVHEIENLLLEDVDALLGCTMHTARRPRTNVEPRIVQAAQARIWWVTCIRFLSETKEKSREGYPSDPEYSRIQSLQDAEQYVLASTWFKTTAQCCPGLAVQAAVSQELLATHAAVNQEFATGTWRQEFPGKEIVRDIATYLSPGNSLRDFIKSVGDWQRESAIRNGTSIPLSPLRGAILARVGTTP